MTTSLDALDLMAMIADVNGGSMPVANDPAPVAMEVPVRAHTRRARQARQAGRASRVATPAPAAHPTSHPASHPTTVHDRERPLPAVSSKAERAAARQRDYERLEPIALELAAKVGAAGFTADNLRRAAITAGVLTGDEGKIVDGETSRTTQQRALSWLGPFLTSLARRGAIAPLTYPDGAKVKRQSDRPEAHANAHVVYVLPEFSRR